MPQANTHLLAVFYYRPIENPKLSEKLAPDLRGQVRPSAVPQSHFSFLLFFPTDLSSYFEKLMQTLAEGAGFILKWGTDYIRKLEDE